MLHVLKQAALDKAMKLLAHPKVGQLMSDPRLMGALTKGFEIHGQISNRIEEGVRSFVQSLNLVTKEELSKLNNKLGEMENSLGELKNTVARSQKPTHRPHNRPNRRPPAKKNRPAPTQGNIDQNQP